MAKKTAKAAPKAKSKKPAPKPAPKKAAKPAKPVKKAAPAAKSAKGKPSATKKPAVKSKPAAKPSPAKPAAKPAVKPAAKPAAKPATAKQAPAKQAPVKPAPKKATPPPAKTPDKRIPDKKANVSVTKSSAKPDSMSSTAVNKSAKPKSKTSTTEPQRNFAPYEMKKGEEYMNDQQKEHFKRILLNWRDELMQEVDRTVHHMQDEAANPPDPADRATLEEEFSIELRTRDRERRLIKKIDSTIELIANDEYGYCDSCGVEIGIRRLEARPTANKCIDCKTLDEIKEKQLGSA